MIPTKANVDSTIDGMETAAFTIEVTDKSFRVLLDGLYTDKPQSIIRELWTNALDSHIDAGIPDQPFHCKLPTVLEPTFSVRDYGTSMSHEDVMYFYSRVFASKKTETNAQTGMLGLGSKSPFSYTDAFSVIAYSGTEKRTYLAAMNTDGIPTITHLSDEPSGEPRGFEVSFAVSSQDHTRFQHAAQKVALGFDVLPTTPGFEFEPIVPLFSAEGIAIYERDNNYYRSATDTGLTDLAYVRQGPVLYPVPTEFVNQMRCFNRLRGEVAVVIQVPMATVDFTASRESIQLTDSTRNYLNERFSADIEKVIATAENDIAEQSTVYDTHKSYADWSQMVDFEEELNLHNTPLGRYSRGKLPVLDNGPMPTMFRLTSPKSRKLERVTTAKISWWSFNDIPSLKFVCGVKNSKVHRQKLRFREYVNDHGNRNIFWLENPTADEVLRLVRLLRLDWSQIIRVQDLPDVEVERTSSGGGTALGVYSMSLDGRYLSTDRLNKDPEYDYYWIDVERAQSSARCYLPKINRSCDFGEKEDMLSAPYHFMVHYGVDRPVLFLTPRAMKRLDPAPANRFDAAIAKLIEDNLDDIKEMLKVPDSYTFTNSSAGKRILEKIKPSTVSPTVVRFIRGLNMPEVQDAYAERERVEKMYMEKYPMAFSPDRQQVYDYMDAIDAIDNEGDNE